jgi:3-deoxy-D-manno-octulosonic-acid transferase
VFFIARHGKGHAIPPSDVPHRANIFALKSLGVDRIVAITAVGSLKEDRKPCEKKEKKKKKKKKKKKNRNLPIAQSDFQ